MIAILGMNLKLPRHALETFLDLKKGDGTQGFDHDASHDVSFGCCPHLDVTFKHVDV